MLFMHCFLVISEQYIESFNNLVHISVVWPSLLYGIGPYSFKPVSEIFRHVGKICLNRTGQIITAVVNKPPF